MPKPANAVVRMAFAAVSRAGYLRCRPAICDSDISLQPLGDLFQRGVKVKIVRFPFLHGRWRTTVIFDCQVVVVIQRVGQTGEGMRPSPWGKQLKHPASFRREQNIGQSRAMRADNRLRLAERFDLLFEAVPAGIEHLETVKQIHEFRLILNDTLVRARDVEFPARFAHGQS